MTFTEKPAGTLAKLEDHLLDVFAKVQEAPEERDEFAALLMGCLAVIVSQSASPEAQAIKLANLLLASVDYATHIPLAADVSH